MQQVFRIKTGKWYKFPGILFPGLVLHRCQRAVGLVQVIQYIQPPVSYTHLLSVRAENLPALRRRMNDWAARECPVLYTPPLECDLSIRLDRVTVESVARLDQLAPYGAENPTPVFLLEKAVVEGIYPVSEGKHCRLRLRQGNASIYAAVSYTHLVLRR